MNPWVPQQDMNPALAAAGGVDPSAWAAAAASGYATQPAVTAQHQQKKKKKKNTKNKVTKKKKQTQKIKHKKKKQIRSQKPLKKNAVAEAMKMMSDPEMVMERPPLVKAVRKYGPWNPVLSGAFNAQTMMEANPMIGHGFGLMGTMGNMAALKTLGPGQKPVMAKAGWPLGPWSGGRHYRGGSDTGAYVGLSPFPYSSRMWHRGALMGGAAHEFLAESIGTKNGLSRLRRQVRFIEQERERAAVLAGDDMRREQELGRAEMLAREKQLDAQAKASWYQVDEALKK